MKKIKVAQIITRMDWGGSSDIVRILCSRLDPGIYDVRLISGLTRYPSLKTRKLFEGLKGNLSIVPQLRREINPFLDALALVRLYRILRQEKFDIVHTHTAKAGALGRIAAYAAGVPVIIHTPHGHNFYGYFGPFFSRAIIIIERILSKLATRITVFTELEKNDFVRLNAAPAKKIVIIYQGLELSGCAQAQQDRERIRQGLGIKPDERVIGMVSRLEPIKGPGYFIEAAARVSKELSNVKFLIIGEGSLRQSLEERAGALGIRSQCIFAGWQENAQEIISVLDLLVLPSLNEAVGMVLVEAQSQGIPVIASRVGGIPEVVKDGDTGILVSPGNIDELAVAIGNLLQDEGKTSQMGKNGQQWVCGKFSAENMITAVSEIYGFPRLT